VTEREVSFSSAAAAYAGSLIAGVAFIAGGAIWFATMAAVSGRVFLGRDRTLDRKAVKARGVVERTRIMRNVHANRKHPYKIEFTFVDRAGRERRGVSYTWGAPPEEGQEVEVEYLPEDPRRSRVVRTSYCVPFAWLQVLGFAMALAGVILACRGYLGTRRRLTLLRTGSLAEGEVTEARLGFSHLGRRRQVKLRYTFSARGLGETEGRDSVYAVELPPSGSKVAIAYDERDPSVNVVYSLEPARADARGTG